MVKYTFKTREKCIKLKMLQNKKHRFPCEMSTVDVTYSRVSILVFMQIQPIYF